MKKYTVFAVVGLLAAFLSYRYTRDMPSATEAYYVDSGTTKETTMKIKTTLALAALLLWGAIELLTSVQDAFGIGSVGMGS